MIVQYKTSHCEPSYTTYTDVEKTANYYRSKARRKQKAERMYFIKQKLSGVTMVTIGIITPFLLDGDATFSLIAVPMGVWLLISKQKIMMFRG